MTSVADLYPDLDEIIHDKRAALPSLSGDALGEACEDLCLFYRAAAVGALLLELDAETFDQMLARSGLTRAYYLKRTPLEDRLQSRYGRITRSNGLFDALASHRWDVAEQIADHGPAEWNARYEYEDDYAYVRFLHLSIQQADDGLRHRTLDRWADVLGGRATPRLRLCETLLKDEADSFDEAFADVLRIRADELVAADQSIARNDVALAADRHVFVEGLALLRLAEAAGFPTRSEYPACPREARIALRDAS